MRAVGIKEEPYTLNASWQGHNSDHFIMRADNEPAFSARQAASYVGRDHQYGALMWPNDVYCEPKVAAVKGNYAV
jgi:hypothetical protein